jgi:hypothetical protein
MKKREQKAEDKGSEMKVQIMGSDFLQCNDEPVKELTGAAKHSEELKKKLADDFRAFSFSFWKICKQRIEKSLLQV